MPDGVVEVLDDGHVDIRGGQAFQSLVGMQEQRRCGAGQHLVGMVVERDDRGLRTARVGLADEVLQEIARDPRCSPSKTPMTAKIGPSSGRRPSTPATTSISAGAPRRRVAGADEHLVRGEATGSGRDWRSRRARPVARRRRR